MRRVAVVMLAVLCAACADGSHQATGGQPVQGAMYRSAQPGSLPPSPVLGGVTLPAGHLVPTQTAPVLWISDAAVPDLADRLPALRSAFPQTGLWPLALESLASDATRPWDSPDLDPKASNGDIATVDVGATLERWWKDAAPDEEGGSVLHPFGRRFPGMAAATSGPVNDGTVNKVAGSLHGRLGLVPVARPADVPRAIGWTGPTNYYSDMTLLSAVLRTWEDRFGAELVGIGFDTITLAVRRPPRDDSEAEHVAAEHFAVCPDNVAQGPDSIGAYAEELVDRDVWRCWWD